MTGEEDSFLSPKYSKTSSPEENRSDHANKSSTKRTISSNFSIKSILGFPTPPTTINSE